jgi:predicted ribosome quality control (RQC) complex YloA/Tae2 family protein
MAANKNYRKFILETGREITGGKNSEQNDLLVGEAWPTNILLHTEAPGSPFVNVGNDPTKDEISEAAIFCALKSQIWRDKHSNVKVNVFRKSDMTKSRVMKSGSWAVGKLLDTIKVSKMSILKLENEL